MSATDLLRRHPDAWLAGIVTAVYLGEIAVKAERPGLLLITAVAVGLVILVRKRWPVPAVVLCVATFLLVDELDPAFNQEGGLGHLATWLLAHFALGRWTVGPLAAIAPFLAVGGAVLLGKDDIGAGIDTGDLAFFLSLSLLPWGAGLAARLRHDHMAALRAENERLEREQLEAAKRAVIEERSRIARELHDVVSHAISVTVLQARGARRMLGQDTEQVRQSLTAIEQTNTAALSDMRRLLAVLRDTEDEGEAKGHEPQPSLARLDDLVDQVRNSGVGVEVSVSGQRVDVPPGVDLSAYRIVQESLTNVLKHASGAAAEVSLEYRPDELLVSVRDTGGAATGDEPSGHGLVGIRERVAVIGGDVVAGPAEGGGYQLTARLPYSVEVP